ncbi:MAG: hypothetical protein EBU23_16235 [Mycobacteriaceae bacterium]|nr:hypothetical protein [Mycobacteriaceae bacterium]
MSDDDRQALVDQRQAQLRNWCAVLGGIGAVLSFLAAFRAFDAFSFGGVFDTFAPRAGTLNGGVAMLMALITIGGAIVVRRSPSLGSALLYVGGCGGFLACGGIWFIPGVITLVAANMALWAISDPFTHPREGSAGSKAART